MREKILSLVKLKGPVLPREISKDLGLDSLFAAAHLSELVDQKKMRLSNAKIGGSPIYYLEGQEAKLIRLVEYLNEKDRRAHDLLQEKKIVEDKELNPLFQVAMRNIKDFAVPLRVNKTELFWKYFLVPDQEAIGLIKEVLMARQQKQSPAQPVQVPETKPVAVAEPVAEKQKIEIAKPVVQEKIEKPVIKIKEEKEKPKPKKARIEKKKTEPVLEKQKEMGDFEPGKNKDGAVDSAKGKEKSIDDEFYNQIEDFCDKKNIKILSAEIIRKGKEIELKLLVPSVIGNVEYFAKAKNKKKSNDGDLSTTYIKAQSKNMPALYLTPGDVSKKAMEMIGIEFKQLIVKKLE
ncbi:hypothetical protein KY325_00845 [Candidatus Woesearchaeota archaeon]|nr:hypothetical protein [Candidatus Woesearchaeota archaeon]